jgi:hypothetical protein
VQEVFLPRVLCGEEQIRDLVGQMRLISSGMSDQSYAVPLRRGRPGALFARDETAG